MPFSSRYPSTSRKYVYATGPLHCGLLDEHVATTPPAASDGTTARPNPELPQQHPTPKRRKPANPCPASQTARTTDLQARKMGLARATNPRQTRGSRAFIVVPSPVAPAILRLRSAPGRRARQQPTLFLGPPRGGSGHRLGHRRKSRRFRPEAMISENWRFTGRKNYGHGWFRTTDLSRVKRALSH